MDRKTGGWLFREHSFISPPAEDPFAQEDAETRSMIHHYLYLADSLLSHYFPLQDLTEEEPAA